MLLHLSVCLCRVPGLVSPTSLCIGICPILQAWVIFQLFPEDFLVFSSEFLPYPHSLEALLYPVVSCWYFIWDSSTALERAGTVFPSSSCPPSSRLSFSLHFLQESCLLLPQLPGRNNKHPALPGGNRV